MGLKRHLIQWFTRFIALSTSDVEADYGKAIFFNYFSCFGIKIQRFNEDD